MTAPQKRDFSRVRIREHVNPLCIEFQQPVEIPDWQTIYANCDRPLHLDIGCGRGRFMLKMAAVQPDWNFLGLEIRKPLVTEANQWRDWQDLRNLHYVFCNANNALSSLLASLPSGKLQRVSIQFPDPWFKRRHQKRRVVQDDLIHEIATFLNPGGILFLQSDVLEIATEMRDRGLDHSAFQEQQPGWLAENPLPVATERETSTLSRGEAVYRTALIRL